MSLFAQFQHETGSAQVPYGFVSADGFRLGRWVAERRRERAAGELASEKIAELDRLNFEWASSTRAERWRTGLDRVDAYISAHGNAAISTDYTGDDGFPLGRWVAERRSEHRSGAISAKRRAELEQRGFVWIARDPDDEWRQHIIALSEYVRVHGDAVVPGQHVTASGLRLGNWVRYARSRYRDGMLSPECVDELDQLGFIWVARQVGRTADDARRRSDERFAVMFDELTSFARVHGHANVPYGWSTDAGVRLGAWLSRKRIAKRQGTLPAEHIAALDALRINWNPSHP